VKNRLISGAIMGVALGIFLVATRTWSTWAVFVGVFIIGIAVQASANYILFRVAGRRNE
jgi:F0F1-type ATP synthase assembly protein I